MLQFLQETFVFLYGKFMDNVTWIFSGVGCLFFSFILGRKSAISNIGNKTNIQKGQHNNFIENYNEYKPTVYNLKKGVDINYNAGIQLAFENGIPFYPISDGILVLSAWDAQLLIDGHEIFSIHQLGFEQQTQFVYVKKKDKIEIKYKKAPRGYPKLVFYPEK